MYDGRDLLGARWSGIAAVFLGVILAAGLSFGQQSQRDQSEARRASSDEYQARPLRLGAATNFSQGRQPDVLAAAFRLQLLRFRDSIRWGLVENSPGSYQFERPETSFPAEIAKHGGQVTLTVNSANQLYDGGATPYSPQAVQALAKFVAATVARYDVIDTVEVGNEFNGSNFVSGPVKAGGLARRGDFHMAIVRAIAREVRTVRPNVKILGGAAHSIPAGYIWPLLEGDRAHDLDGLAFHPYTTPIDQLGKQIAFLRRNPTAATKPLYVTEFGSKDPKTAADELLRGYAILASVGVVEMDWYPLSDRGDGHVPLIAKDGSTTSAGHAFRFIQSHLSDRIARDISPDPFTFVIAFGPDIQVVWGAERSIKINSNLITAFDAIGNRLDPAALWVKHDRPVVLVGKVPIDTKQIQLGCSPLIADSFYQFGYPDNAKGPIPGDGFERFIQIAHREMAFAALPGQQRPGAPWTPYLGTNAMPQLRVTANSLLPAVGLNGGDIVHRYVSDRKRFVAIEARFVPDVESSDGIAVTISRNGEVIIDKSGKSPVELNQSLALAKGDILTFTVGPNNNSQGDSTRYRITISDEEKCLKT